jgi:hypothetical protein
MKNFDPLFEHRRQLLVHALGAAAGIALPLNLRAQVLLGGKPDPLPPGRAFYRITGDVTVNGQFATLATPVRPVDTIATCESSEAIFVVGSQSMLLRERSQVELERAAVLTDLTALVIAGLRLTGKLLSVSRDVGQRVHTQTATIGIRGTGWYAESDPDLTYFCTCYGETDMVSNDDPASRETVISKQHDRPLYIAREGPEGGRIRNAPFINHTDQELMLIEALVGRAPPFVFPRDNYRSPQRKY